MIVGGSIAFISFVTGVIGVWPILFRDASNFSSLTIAAAPYATGAAEFVLPAGTDVSTYPIGEAACSAAQLAWLTERAVPLERRWLLDLRNIASEGAMLALTRFEAVSEPAAGDEGIRVVCDAAGTADRIQAARLTVDEPGATALFEASAFGVSNEAIPDVPVAWNLAPGESGNLVLDLAAIAPTSGTVQVTVHSGTEQRIVAIEGLAFTVPGMVDAGRRYLVAGAAGLECRVAGSEEPCDPAVLLAG